MHQQPWYDKPPIVLLGALLLWIGYVYVCHPDTIRYENYGLIERAMSRGQVEDLLGFPPGDYSTGTVEYEIRTWNHHVRPNWTSWSGNEGTIRVIFDAEAKVTSKEWVQAQREYSFAWWCKQFGW